jgi:hypothetical protein
MRKRISIFLIVLIIASLACMESVAPATDQSVVPSAEPTLTNVPAIHAVPAEPTLTNAVPLRICALEQAEQAENLRLDADPDAKIITQLLHGDVVYVISQADPNWWFVESEARVGYARSLYLEIVDCK